LSDCSRTAPRRTTATLSAFSRTISPPTQHPIARARVRAQTRINIPRISCVPICSNATKLRRFNGRKSQLLIAHDHLGRSPPYSSAASSERSPTGGDLKSFCNRAICLLVRRAASPGSREHDATSDGVPFDRVGPNPERLASLTWPSPSSHPQNICWARRRPSDVAARNMPQRQPPSPCGAQRLFFGTHAFEILDFAHSLERRIAADIAGRDWNEQMVEAIEGDRFSRRAKTHHQMLSRSRNIRIGVYLTVKEYRPNLIATNGNRG
jgi:hypothetical protein